MSALFSTKEVLGMCAGLKAGDLSSWASRRLVVPAYEAGGGKSRLYTQEAIDRVRLLHAMQGAGIPLRNTPTAKARLWLAAPAMLTALEDIAEIAGTGNAIGRIANQALERAGV